MLRKNNYKPNSRFRIICFGLLLMFTICPILVLSYAGINAFKDFQTFPAQPQHITLAEAPSLLAGKEEIWVILDDIQWDCNYLFHNKTTTGVRVSTTSYTTYILFTNKNKNIAGLASFSGQLTCEQIVQQEKEAVGVLQLVDGNRYHERHAVLLLTQKGFDIGKYQISNKFLWFCHTCGGRNDAIRDIFLSSGAILFLLFILVIITSWLFWDAS